MNSKTLALMNQLFGLLSVFGILLVSNTADPVLAGGDHDHDHEKETSEKHEDHEDHEPGLVVFDPAGNSGLNPESAPVTRRTRKGSLELPATVRFDPNRVAHLTPRVSGVVRRVFAQLGDRVEAGQRLALLESRELGTAWSRYLAAKARLDLRRRTYEREKQLWQKKISPEMDYLNAQQALEEARIDMLTAGQALSALGFDRETLQNQSPESLEGLNSYALTAPYNGIITQQHISPGEVLHPDDTGFVVTDPSRVWVMARVSEHDLRNLRVGQKTTIKLDAFPEKVFSGRPDYIGADVNPDSRTLDVRVVLENPEGLIRAGMFAKVLVFRESGTGSLSLPESALTRFENGHAVFKREAPGRFRRIPVTVLNRSGGFVWIKGNLSEGDRVAVSQTFLLKSEADKAAMGAGHSH